MEYHNIGQTVVETSLYLKMAEAIFSEDERTEIVAMISADPKCGDLIPGTGGFRKVRVGRSGMGKRGGARVIYILRSQGFPIFLVSAYAKNEKANLTQRERNELAQLAEIIFSKYKR